MVRVFLSATVRFLLAAALGTAAVLAGVPLAKYHAVKSSLSLSRGLCVANRHRDALRRLRGIEPWAAPHPGLGREMQCELARCLAGIGNVPAAEKMAEALLSGRAPAAAGAPGLTEAVQRPARRLINATLASGDGAGLTPWSGYRVMVDELRITGQPEALQEALTGLLRRHPDNPVASRDKSARLASDFAPRQAPAAGGAPTPGAAPAGTPAPAAKQWGVVKVQSGTALDRSGNVVGRAPGGLTLTVSSLFASASGQMALCSAVTPSSLPPEFVMNAAEIELRAGAYADASDGERALVGRKATLEVNLGRAQRQADEAARGRNPFAAEYERAQAQYRTFWDRAKDLQAKRDAATGDARMRYGDELRMMKGRDIELGRNLKAAKEKYDAWNRDHSGAPAPDARTEAMKAEIARLDAELGRIGGRR
jgi:hypothetical protein